MSTLTDDLQSLCSDTRLRIFKLISASEKGLRSSQIALELNLKTSITSHHLKILESREFLVGHKIGRHVLYRFNVPKWERFLEQLDELE